MAFDFEPYFSRYETLQALADEAFRRVAAAHPDEVRCALRCADCCHALFDLTLIEALYIHHRAMRHIQGKSWEDLLERANQADRELTRIKRQAYREQEAGRDEELIIAEMAGKRVRCPLLDRDDTCQLYTQRPITCRVYGIPTAIQAKGHTCGKSGFEAGRSYPTVQLDRLQEKLLQLSQELAQALNSRYAGLAQLLVPVSMALLLEWDDAYLGVRPAAAGTAAQASDTEEPGDG
jgi:Fe-S-cluster containining protein